MADKDNSLMSVVHGAGIVSIGIIISYGFSFLYQVISARVLSVEEFGLLSVGILILGIGITLGQVGLSLGAKRFVSYYLSKKDYSKVKGTLISSYCISGGLSIIVAFLIFVFSGPISIFIFDSRDLIPIIRIFAVAIPFATFLVISNEVYLGFKKPFFRVISDAIFEKVGRFIFLLIAIIFGASAITIGYAYIAGLICAFLVAFFLIQNLYSNMERKPFLNYGEVMAFSFPLFLTSATGEVLKRFDKLIIGSFLTLSDVGIYQISFSLAELLSLGIFALSAIYYPVIIGYLAEGKKNLIADMFASVSRLSVMITLPIFVLFILFSKEVISLLFGQGYMEGGISLVILSIGFMFMVFMGPLISTLEVLKKTKLIFYVMFITVFVNLMLNIFLIPFFGINGVAVATCITFFVQGILFFHYLKREIPLKFSFAPYIKFVLSGVIAFFIFFIIKNLFLSLTIFHLVILGLLFIGIYVLLLLLFKSFNEDDKIVLKSVEKKLHMKKSIIDQIM